MNFSTAGRKNHGDVLSSTEGRWKKERVVVPCLKWYNKKNTSWRWCLKFKAVHAFCLFTNLIIACLLGFVNIEGFHKVVPV